MKANFSVFQDQDGAWGWKERPVVRYRRPGEPLVTSSRLTSANQTFSTESDAERDAYACLGQDAERVFD